MYIPKFNQENDTSILHSLIKAKPLGAWTTLADGEIAINHIPFILHNSSGALGTLVGHVARANPIFQKFSKNVNSIVVFQGEQAYISPSWYPSKYQHGKVVPTWNYIVVHAHGIPKIIEDPEWLLQHVNELTDLHESEQKLPWKVADAPKEFITKLLDAIVGIEIPIVKLVGKWKLGQNRPAPDQLGMAAGLISCGNSESQSLAQQIKQRVDLSVTST